MVRAGRPRLGQHFLADTNLLDAIVRGAELSADDVVLEVGGGAGALSERLAPLVAHLHVIELDERLREQLGAVASANSNATIHWGDAMDVDLGALDPTPTKIVSNLPYSIATPLILRTIEDCTEVDAWTVMVQREIADRLRAEPGTRTYGAPSVLVQLACEVELLRTVDPAVFVPRPRVGSALIWLERRAPAASADVGRLVHDAFAHRRKALARSVELASGRSRAEVLAALQAVGLAANARAETLTPEDFAALAERMR
jgi:16S rRNA (adenine1518-N6/adenine1519-N6)-dimethyltransferase